MAYSGLETLFQNLGPSTASLFAGEREGMAQQADLQEQMRQQQLIREIQLKNAQSQVMNPLLAQHQGLQNQGLELGLSGITADSSLKATNAAKAAGTLATDISAGNSNNQTTIGANQVKQGLDKGQLISQTAVELDNLPPVLRTGALMAKLKQYGFDPQSPQIQGLISQVSPENLPEALRKFGERVALTGKTAAQYSQEQIHKDDRASNERVARMRVDEQRYATDARKEIAAARLQATSKKALSIQEQASAGKLSYEKAAVAFQTMADMEEDAPTKAKLLDAAQKYEKAAQLLKTANQAGTVDVSKMGNGLPIKPAQGALGGSKALSVEEMRKQLRGN